MQAQNQGLCPMSSVRQKSCRHQVFGPDIGHWSLRNVEFVNVRYFFKCPVSRENSLPMSFIQCLASDIRCPIFQCLILCHLFGLLSNVQCPILCPMSNVQRLELHATGVFWYPVFLWSGVVVVANAFIHFCRSNAWALLAQLVTLTGARLQGICA